MSLTQKSSSEEKSAQFWWNLYKIKRHHQVPTIYRLRTYSFTSLKENLLYHQYINEFLHLANFPWNQFHEIFSWNWFHGKINQRSKWLGPRRQRQKFMPHIFSLPKRCASRLTKKLNLFCWHGKNILPFPFPSLILKKSRTLSFVNI